MRRRNWGPDPRGRRLYGFAAIGIVTGIIVFLLVFPSVEREAYLAQLKDASSESRGDALLHLCWTRSGKEGLNHLLDDLAEDQRVEVLGSVSDAGCLDNVAPRHRALYLLHSTTDIDRLVAQGKASHSFLIDGLTSQKPGLATRAERAIIVRLPTMTEEERSRVLGLVYEHPERFALLRVDLEVADPVVELPLEEPAWEVEAERDAVQATAWDSATAVFETAMGIATAPVIMEPLELPSVELRLEPVQHLTPPARGPALFMRDSSASEDSDE